MKHIFYSIIFLAGISVFGQIERVETPSWWGGFEDSNLQLLVHGKDAGKYTPSLYEKTIDRSDDYARHGGDIRGIIDHLDYIDEMGFTAMVFTLIDQ